MKMAITSQAMTPEQLRALADTLEAMGIAHVDLVPQITESKGQWFRLDGDALKAGKITFEPEDKD